MGYVFLAISLLCGATKGYCGKRTSGHTERITDAVYANLLRMLLCIVIGFFVVLFSGKQPALGVDAKTLAICLFSGLSTSVMAVSWLLAVKKGAYMLVDVFGMLGFTVPIVGSVVCFGEHDQTDAGFCHGLANRRYARFMLLQQFHQSQAYASRRFSRFCFSVFPTAASIFRKSCSPCMRRTFRRRFSTFIPIFLRLFSL